MSIGDSRMECVHSHLSSLGLLTVGVAVLESSQLHKYAYNVSFESLKMFCVM